MYRMQSPPIPIQQDHIGTTSPVRSSNARVGEVTVYYYHYHTPRCVPVSQDLIDPFMMTWTSDRQARIPGRVRPRTGARLR